MKPYFQDKDVTIYNCDCREILPSLPKVDLVLTDPPYGIAYSSKDISYPGAKFTEPIRGDESQDVAKWLLSLVDDSQTFVIWGANNFPQLLPFPGIWLCWDKRVIDEADVVFGWPFELAWVNKTHGKAHLYRIQHGGPINADGKNTPRYHPTQKPVSLFSRIIQDFKAQTILDPFMGSGTTLRAAKNLGRKAIGIEIEEKYCEIATRRMAQTVMALDI